MDINFIEQTEEGKRFGDIEDGDVVILPAFGGPRSRPGGPAAPPSLTSRGRSVGASLEEMQMLDQRGVTVVDTTCPWVSKARGPEAPSAAGPALQPAPPPFEPQVWTTVDKHAQKQMTSVPRARRGGAPRPSPRYRPLRPSPHR